MGVLVGCTFVVALVIGLSAFMGWIFWLLWGYVAVPVFGAPVMSFYQAWALWFLLCMVGNIFKTSVKSAGGK